MRKSKFRLGVPILRLTLFVVIFGAMAWAGAKGTVKGKVVDPLGAVVPNAVVSLAQAGKIVTTVKTGQQGEFELTGVEAGMYTLKVEAEGFAILERATVVQSGETSKVDAALEVGALRQQVVVSDTGTALPESQVGASVSVIDQTELNAYHKLDLHDALRQVPGLTVIQAGQRGGTTSVFARGGSSEFNKVLLDGVPANDIGGTFDFANYSAASAGQVEVLRGANSVVYGADALGSVIEVTSRRGSTPFPELSYSIDGGNFGTMRQDVSLGGVYHRFDYFGNFMRFDTQNSLPNSSFHNGSVFGNFGWQASPNTSLRFTVHHDSTGLGVPNALALYGIADDSSQHQQDTYLSLKLDNQTTSKWRNTLNLTSTNIRYSFDQPSPVGIPFEGNYLGDYVNLCGANGYCASGQAILDWGGTYPSLTNSHTAVQSLYGLSNYTIAPEFSASAGFRYDHEGGYMNSLGTFYRTTRDNFGSFVETHGSLGHRVFATAGVGMDDNAVYGFAATPRVSLAYYLRRPAAGAFFNGTKLRFNYGTGIDEPSILHQGSSLFYLLSGLSNGPALISQYHVDPIGPERSRNFDWGVDQYLFGGRARLGITGFRENFYNLIAFVSNNLLPQLGVPAAVAAAVPYGATVNSDSFHSLGAEIELEAKLRRDLRVEANYTYTDAVVSQSFASSAQSPASNPAFPNIAIGLYSPLIGGRPFGIPRNSGSLSAIYSRRGWGVSGTAYCVSRSDDSTFLTDEYYGNSLLLPNRDLLNSYQLVDWSGWYDVHHGVSLYTSVGNLLSEHYQSAYGYPALPFNFRAGVRFTIGGEGWKRK